MIDIRPVRDEEAEDFLELLCDVFELDFARAQSIFYNEPLFDLRRKWALFDRGKMTSVLTTVPLEFGWGRAIGIAGVATVLERRGKGLAEKLLNAVLSESERMGEAVSFLFAKQITLYERCGFQLLDQVIRAPIRSARDEPNADQVEFPEVMRLYDAWAEGHPHRLRRDERRWNYWKWNFKICSPVEGGYLCPEGSMMRECLVFDRIEHWPVMKGTQWFGLTSMAVQMKVPIGQPRSELFLMGRNAPGVPQMFMTDQF